MKHENYTVFDFVKNEDFQKWVKNPDEKSDFYWGSWIQNHSDKKHIVLEAKEILASISFPSDKASEGEIEEIFEHILRNERQVSLRKIDYGTSRKSYSLNSVFRIAAALLILATFGFLIYKFDYKSDVPKAEVEPVEYIKSNPIGRKSTFHLPDGSIIILNSASNLRIADDFGIENREVYLEGEAFFEVAKNLQKPFKVHTGNLTTLVTGTVFNINAYPENKDIKVAVFKGSVNTLAHHKNRVDTLSLEKSDMAVYNKSNNSLAKTDFNFIEAFGWKDGIIYFHDANSEEVFNYLERWYGVDIQVQNSEGIFGTFHGEFEKEILTNVLSQIGTAMQFDYEFIDKYHVLIKPKKNEHE